MSGAKGPARSSRQRPTSALERFSRRASSGPSGPWTDGRSTRTRRRRAIRSWPPPSMESRLPGGNGEPTRRASAPPNAAVARALIPGTVRNPDPELVVLDVERAIPAGFPVAAFLSDLRGRLGAGRDRMAVRRISAPGGLNHGAFRSVSDRSRPYPFHRVARALHRSLRPPDHPGGDRPRLHRGRHFDRAPRGPRHPAL